MIRVGKAKAKDRRGKIGWLKEGTEKTEEASESAADYDQWERAAWLERASVHRLFFAGSEGLEILRLTENLGWGFKGPKLAVYSGTDDDAKAKTLLDPAEAFMVSPVPMAADLERAERYAESLWPEFARRLASIDSAWRGTCYVASLIGYFAGGTTYFAMRCLDRALERHYREALGVCELRVPVDRVPRHYLYNLQRVLEQRAEGGHDRSVTILYPAQDKDLRGSFGGRAQIVSFRSHFYKGLRKETDLQNALRSMVGGKGELLVAVPFILKPGMKGAEGSGSQAGGVRAAPPAAKAADGTALVSLARLAAGKGTPFAFEAGLRLELEPLDHVDGILIVEGPASQEELSSIASRVRVEIENGLVRELSGQREAGFVEEVVEGREWAATGLLGPFRCRGMRVGSYRVTLESSR
jgi:hypothetical protein